MKFMQKRTASTNLQDAGKAGTSGSGGSVEAGAEPKPHGANTETACETAAQKRKRIAQEKKSAKSQKTSEIKKSAAEEKKEEKKKEAEKELIATAKNNLMRYSSIVTQAEILIRNVNGNQEWEDSKTDADFPKLQKALAQLSKTCMNDPILSRALTLDFSKLKSKMGEADYSIALRALGALAAPLDILSGHMEILQDCHEVRIKKKLKSAAA